MNREFAIKLIHTLESLPRRQFHMADWIRKDKCGTVACVAGWATVVADGKEAASHTAESRGRKLLGLSATQAYNLFHAHGLNEGVADANAGPKEAAETLRRMLANDGRVSWTRAVENVKKGIRTPIREEVEQAALLARAEAATGALRVTVLPEPVTGGAAKVEKVKL